MVMFRGIIIAPATWVARRPAVTTSARDIAAGTFGRDWY